MRTRIPLISLNVVGLAAFSVTRHTEDRREHQRLRYVRRPEDSVDSLQPLGRAQANRLGVPVMTRLHQCTMRRLCRRCMVIWALHTVTASAGHCCPALLPTCKIAGKGVRTPAAAERAPRIRICRLRVAKLRLAQQAAGHDKKRDGQHAHHISLPVVVFACFSYYHFSERAEMRALGGTPELIHHRRPARRVTCLRARCLSRWPVAGSSVATPVNRSAGLNATLMRGP
jgi:hypothetical protein